MHLVHRLVLLTGGVCCAGAVSDCAGSWSSKWATDCQGYVCCIGTCTGTCYGPSYNQITTACTGSDYGIYPYTKGDVVVDYKNGTIIRF